jgi:hypothetical protein
VPLLILLVAVPVLLIALTPLMLLQRYRVGTARRLARPWVARVTLGAMTFSAGVFLTSAAVTAIWVPRAFMAALAGLGLGLVLGILGTWLARWEATPRALHYTPNRPLVLVITLVVVARVGYGLWRSWSVARAGFGGASAIGAFGIPESLAAAATVIGYYLAFTAGVRARIRQWEKRPLRVL